MLSCLETVRIILKLHIDIVYTLDAECIYDVQILALYSTFATQRVFLMISCIK